jgi:putative ABC transport system substrate-binding protein
MDRRTFVSGVAGGLVVWPLAAHAQRQGLPVIGYLANASAAGFTNYVDAFRRGLGEMGYVEGQNVAIEYRWTEGQRDRLPGFARDLADRQVAVIVATGGGAPALAAKAATTSIPIVFTGGTDPVRSGLVASLGRPGGNATGVLNADTALKAKRLAFLREVVPAVTLIAVLINPASTDAQEMSEIQEAARTLGLQIAVVEARNEGDLDHVFATIIQTRAGALFVTGDPLFTGARTQLTALAAKYAIPASYSFRDLVVAGGLMSYGVNLPDVHRQAGVYTGRILKGAKPADLPVLQPTKFDLVINMKTAKALGITIPQSVLLRAEEVIQ